MQKGYILFAHRSPADPKKREAYIKLAFPAIKSAGGKVLAQSKNVIVKENGINERTILVEFDTLEKAKQFYKSEEYAKIIDIRKENSTGYILLVEGY